MPRRVRELVQERDCRDSLVHEQRLAESECARGLVAEDATAAFVGALDVLEPPRRPERLRHAPFSTIAPMPRHAFRVVLAASAAVAIAAVAAVTLHGGTKAPARTHAVVEWVTDGDTVRLRNGARVRLVQIDAPEESSECYGRAATRELLRFMHR